jgi:hypothetical protein
MKLNFLDDYCVNEANNNQFASQKAISKIIDQHLYIINLNREECEEEEKIITPELYSDAIYKLNLIITFYYYSWAFTFRELLSYYEIFTSLELDVWDWIKKENDKNISEELEDAYLNWE